MPYSKTKKIFTVKLGFCNVLCTPWMNLNQFYK